MAHNSQQIARLLQSLLRSTRGRIGTPWLIALLVLVGGYLLAEPLLEARLGVDLPGVHDANQQVADSPRSSDLPEKPQTSTTAGATLEPGDVLEKIGRETYRSEAGLIYTRGSAQGHRLDHLMTHAQDDADRPGQHGVFDQTDQAALVQLVDEAYRLALAGQQTKHRHEQGRDVYTVNMGRRVGYVGGESGGRRGHPAARYIRLVVDDKRFITAFPVKP